MVRLGMALIDEVLDGNKKICYKCKEIQDKAFFKEGRNTCNTCRNLEAVNSRNHMAINSKRHGIAENELQKFLTLQDNKCATCHQEFEVTISKKGFKRVGYRIDHDHSCCSGDKGCPKCIRGLLCHRCNTLLGSYESMISLGLMEVFDAYRNRL